jgi:hypothetical protein
MRKAKVAGTVAGCKISIIGIISNKKIQRW